MRMAIRTEFLKIRTTRMTIGLLSGAGAWTLFVSLVESSRSGAGGLVPSLATTIGLRDVLSSTGFALILAMVFGATLSTGEFRYQTSTDTYIDEPDRRRVMIAKSITAAIVGALFGLLGTAVTTGIGLAFALSNGYHVAMATGTIIRYGVGAVLGASLLAMIGVGVGSFLRNQTAAIIAIFAWAFGVEQVTGGLFHSIARYLPLMAANTMAGAGSGSMPPLPKGIAPMPWYAVVLLLAVIVVVVSALASHTSLRKDIT